MRLLFFVLISIIAVCLAGAELPEVEKMRGVSLVAPPKQFPEDPFPAVTDVGAQWVAVIPYALTRKGQPVLSFDRGQQWWGERSEGVRKTIEYARDSQMKVFLKPHVWVRGAWIGELEFSSEEDWEAWESDYRDYLLTFAKLAEEMKVEAFCVGTEIKKSVLREQFWRALIEDVREVYQGKLTYAANWDDYQQVPFWDALDFIGVDAYFPLVEDKTPAVAQLTEAWKPRVQELESFSKKKQKPIVFTEFGYLSLDGCTYQTWKLERKRKETPINEQAQANALEALFQVFSGKEWWGGGFIWKWYPNYELGNGHYEQYNAGDYTPQGKLSEKTLSRWYKGW